MMAKLMAAVRLLVAFVLGLLLGGIGAVVMITQQWGVSDFFVSATPQVKELRDGLARSEMQRDEMTKKLESVTSVLQQVEDRYEELGKRFDSIEELLRRMRPGAQRPPGGPGGPGGPGAPGAPGGGPPPPGAPPPDARDSGTF
jgi:hypothetical protein